MIELDDEDEEDDAGRRVTGKSSTGYNKLAWKKPRQKGPTDKFVMHPPKRTVQFRKMKQFRDAYTKKIDKPHAKLALFWCHALEWHFNKQEKGDLIALTEIDENNE